MSLEDIVNVTITAQSKTPTRPGFGRQLILVNKVPAGFTNRVRKYSSASGMVDDGFLVTDPAYLAASKAFSQNPRPKDVKIGRRALPVTQTVTIEILSGTAGVVYSGVVGTTTWTRTVPGASNPTAEATAIAALIDADTVVGATAVGAVITCTAAAGILFEVKDLSLIANLKVKNTTADPGVATDLAACQNEDNDWYGLNLDLDSEAQTNAAAAWVEANKKLHVANSSDTGVPDSTDTTDIASDLDAANYARSGILFSRQLLSYSAVAWMANRFAGSDPGGDTWMFKTLPGITRDVLTESQISNALAKNANVYTDIAGISMTQQGKSGSGEYFDVVRFLDWLESEIKIRVFARLANAPKIPYTDAGVDSIVAIINGALQDGIAAGGLADDPAPEVFAPKVADVDPSIRATRVLPDVTFTGRLAGAIHELTINGTLTV